MYCNSRLKSREDCKYGNFLGVFRMWVIVEIVLVSKFRRIGVCVCLHVSVCVCAHLDVRVYLSVCVCLSVCVFVCAFHFEQYEHDTVYSVQWIPHFAPHLFKAKVFIEVGIFSTQSPNFKVRENTNRNNLLVTGGTQQSQSWWRCLSCTFYFDRSSFRCVYWWE